LRGLQRCTRVLCEVASRQRFLLADFVHGLADVAKRREEGHLAAFPD
jgi:hypothetical protein